MIEPTVDRPGASEARDLSGHAGHAALREYWQARGRVVSAADTVTNLNRASVKRYEGKMSAAEYERRAREAHALALGGVTHNSAAKSVGLRMSSMLAWWQRLNLPSPVKARQEAK